MIVGKAMNRQGIGRRISRWGTAMRARRREVVGLIACLVMLHAFGSRVAAQPPEAKRSPNIVLIVADDLGWGDVGFNGRKEWSTPNLDRLAKEGRLFQRFYTAAVVC